MFFKDKSLKKYNWALYLVFGTIGGGTVIVTSLIPISIMSIFFISALFAILLSMSSLIISRGLAEKDSKPIKEINDKMDTLLEKFDVNKPTVTEITLPEPDLAQLPHIIEEWKIVIQTQMHFNDLLIKMRTATLSVVLAVFGATGYSFAAIEISPFTFGILGVIHPAVFIIVSGILILGVVFVVDYKYYYKMLLGAVKQGYEFDNEFQKLENIFGRRYFGMSTKIRNKIGKTDASKYYVMFFYIIPIISGIVFLLAVLMGYQQPSG